MSCPTAIRTAAISSLGVILAGCITLAGRVDEVTTVEGTWTGLEQELRETARNGGKVRLLVVHGIGPHGPGYSDQLVSGLADALGLERAGPHADETVTAGGSGGGPVLGTIRTTTWRGPAEGPGRELRVFEVTWSDAVKPLKDRLVAIDDSEPMRARRLQFNGLYKQDLMNRRLADPVIYLGTFQPAIQFPVELALLRILAEEDPARDRVSVVALSLGSTIVFDCLRKMSSSDYDLLSPVYGRCPIPGFDARIAALSARRHTVFLLANQLALLDLARATPPVPPPAAIGGDDADPAPDWHVDLVAISDPNDLLSYALTDETVERCRCSHIDVRIANVFTTIATQALVGMLADPIQAHAGHAERQVVIDLMVFGPAGRPPAPPPEPPRP